MPEGARASIRAITVSRIVSITATSSALSSATNNLEPDGSRVMPSALPSILTGFRLAAGAGWLTVVTAEMMAVKSGLGYMILYAQMIFRPDQIVAGIIVIGTIGLLFDQLIRMMRTYFCSWQEGLVLEA